MTAQMINSNQPSVVVNDGVLYMNNLVENDLTVVAAVEPADNPVGEVQRLLRLGAQVDRLAGTTLDAEVMEGTALRLTEGFERTVDTAIGEIEKSTKRLLDPNKGTLPSALGAFQTEFAAMLGSSFDPDSRKSIIGKLDNLMKKAATDQATAINLLLDPSSPDSPLSNWKEEISKTVKAESHVVSEQVRELSERIAVQAATVLAKKEAANKMTSKGFAFEDVLHALLEQNALPHQDLAVQTGRALGSCGNQRGDEVVTLNPDDTRGIDVNIVLECKDKKMGLKKILDELDGAMANRNASAGVAVFASYEAAPITSSFANWGDKAILVLDKDDPDPMAVRLAYMWARWVAKRELAGHDDEVDLARVEVLIDDVRRALQRTTYVKKCHTSARKSIDEATASIEVLATEVTTALDQLCDEVNKAA
ncbi:MAG: hypothetical protein QOE58_2286 [Actinomycetota bacterium]|nr:hypothetical protein [Actinomycetota bacterium]